MWRIPHRIFVFTSWYAVNLMIYADFDDSDLIVNGFSGHEVHFRNLFVASTLGRPMGMMMHIHTHSHIYVSYYIHLTITTYMFTYTIHHVLHDMSLCVRTTLLHVTVPYHTLHSLVSLHTQYAQCDHCDHINFPTSRHLITDR